MEVYNGLTYDVGIKKIKQEDRRGQFCESNSKLKNQIFILPLGGCGKTFKSLSEDIKNMMNEPDFQDITLQVGEAVIMCNKFLLCAR
jgi:hypothetical protein